MFHYQDYYRLIINKYGWPKKLDWKDKWLYIHIDKDRVDITHRVIMPDKFKEVEEQLDYLELQLLELLEEYPEIAFKKKKKR